MNVARTGLLLAALTALFLAVGFALGGRGGALIALVVALGTNLVAFWTSDRMVLRMHGARAVDRGSAPDLHAMVEGLARNAGLPMPAVYVIESAQPNAFATGRDPHHAAVAVTTGIVRTLSREELAGVIAHELAHIKNRDTLTMTVAATIAGAIGFIAQFGWLIPAGGSSENRPNPIVAIAMMILAPLAAMLVQMAISRTREFSADRDGALICGEPRWLASALQKIEQAARGTYIPSAERNPATAHLFIVNPLHGGALAGLFRTHPPTEQRIAALLQQPVAAPPPRPQGPRAGPEVSPIRTSVPSSRRRGPWG